AARGTRQRHPRVVRALVGELPQMTPGSDLDRLRQPCVFLSLIAVKLQLSDEKRRIAQAKIQTIAVAGVRIAGARSRWIAIKGCEKERCIFAEIDLQTDARCRQRIGGSTARKIDGSNRRPVALQEHRAEIAEKEFTVGCKLAKPQACRAIEKFPLNP